MVNKRSSNKDFELSFKNSAIGMAIVSPEGKWLRVNPALCAIVDYSEEELLKTDFQTITHEDDLDIDLEYVRQMLAGEIKTYQMEKRYYRKNGDIVWILLSVSLARSEENDEPLYFISQIQDITARKIAEERLKDSQELFDLVARASNDGIWDWPDVAVDEIYWSPQLKKILGYEEHEIESKPSTYFEMIHPDDVEHVSATLEEDLKNMSPSEKEYRVRTKSGEYKWVLGKGIIIPGHKPGSIRMAGSVTDINERKKTELLLKESNERFELVVKGARDGVWDWPDIEDDNCYWSAQFKRILGYEDSEIEARTSVFLDMVHPDDIGYVKQVLYAHLQEGKIFEAEYRVKTKSGQYKWVLAKGISTNSKNPNSKRMTGSLTDIDERKKTELLLKESNERFKLVVEGARDGVWDWPNIKQDTQYWSAKWKELLGYKDYEIEAKASTFFSFVHPEDQELVSSFHKTEITNNSCFDYEYRLRTKDGSYKWFHGRGIATVNNGIIRMTGSLSDISMRKEAEEKLLEYNDELERINEDLNCFAYIASHDLKEPIRGIYSNVLFLEQDFQGELQPEVSRRLGRISFLCERMEKLTDDLLHYAKLKNQDFIIKRIDLNPVIEDLKKTIEKSSDLKNFEINMPVALPKVICDEVTIRELFRNLINNGIKYNDNDHKVIEIGCNEILDKDGIPKYGFYVKDNGVGIAKEHQKDIFHIFKRLDNSANLVQGSGMGLNFAVRIVERHGGKIWVESELGIGSIFHFTLN